MGSPFKTTVSKLYGLSPLKEVTEVDPELVKKAQPVVNWMSDYMKGGTYDYLKKNMIDNLGAKWYYMEAGEEDTLDYLENFPYQVDPETGLTKGPSIVEEKGKYTGAHVGRIRDVGGGKIKMNPESWDIKSGYKSFEAVMAHELGHTEKTTFTASDGVNQEIIKRNKAAQKIYNNKSEEVQKLIDENPRAFAAYLKENYEFEGFHGANSFEVRADLIRLRFVAEDKGVYQSTGEFKKFTQEDLDKMKKEDSSNRLFNNFEDEDLIWLMNNIAMTPEDIQDFTGEKLEKGSALTMRVDKWSGL